MYTRFRTANRGGAIEAGSRFDMNRLRIRSKKKREIKNARGISRGIRVFFGAFQVIRSVLDESHRISRMRTVGSNQSEMFKKIKIKDRFNSPCWERDKLSGLDHYAKRRITLRGLPISPRTFPNLVRRPNKSTIPRKSLETVRSV